MKYRNYDSNKLNKIIDICKQPTSSIFYKKKI